MNTKQKLVYIAIGGLLVATGMIISPLNAQNEKFGDIECDSLRIFNKKGNTIIEMDDSVKLYNHNDELTA